MSRRIRFAIALGLWGTLAGSTRGLSAGAPPAPDPFAACRRQLAEKPQDYESAYCFHETALRLRVPDEAARVFEALMREHPENFWLPLANGHVFRERDPDRTEALYRRAADGFQKAGNADGEILARSNLRNYLFPRGRLEDATAEMQRVSALAATVADPLLKARAWTLEASHVQETGGDLGVAYRLLKQSEGAIFPQGPYRLKRTCLSALGSVAFRTGRMAEALAAYEALDRLATAEGDAREQAATRYNILNLVSLQETLQPTPGAKRRLMRLAERSLESGVSAQHTLVTLKTHGTIAALLAHDSGSRAEALGHARDCLALAVTSRQPHDEAICAWLEASLLRESAPDEARAAEVRALAATARAESPLTQAYSAGRHMQFSWDTKTRPDAIRDSLAAIDAIETLRSLQDEGDSSAGMFATWTLDYYWFSGRLLRDLREGDLDLAFSITERMRARSLLDRLNRSRSRLDPAHPAVASRRSLLEAIAPVQRRLMDPAIKDDERRRTLQELEDLERREQEAQHQIAIAANHRRGATPAFASLAAVQSALGDNEALLSFQVGIWETYEGDFGGGSWLTALTRRGRAVYRIPDRSQLAPMVPVFTGLLAGAGDVAAAGAIRLYEDILADALNALPPGIERLILVPDGPLHRLPFDALRAGGDRRPLAARYELVIAPSATLWLHWRGTAQAPAGRRALAFADPELETSGDRQATERNAVLEEGLRLGRLPHARRESRALERHLGGVEALVGRQASERALKDRNLRDYDILHFAAHAIADDSHPERSAVLLSRGADGEDGLLQAREIEELDLDGRIVVLSACQTASGAVVGGEGVLSLARAFFAAGAQSVIGTRWPIRDQDAAALFDTFYRAVGAGASLSEALTQAKVEAITAGRPAAAWASLVMLGNGAVRPHRGGRHEPSRVVAVRVAISLGSVLLLAFAARTSMRARRATM
jgi:tetratricopeptide (TPR) repeat protein